MNGGEIFAHSERIFSDDPNGIGKNKLGKTFTGKESGGADLGNSRRNGDFMVVAVIIVKHMAKNNKTFGICQKFSSCK